MVYPHNQSLMELEEEKRSEIADSDKSEKDQLEWTSDLEVSLFYSMVGHKPVGPNRFFQMYFVHQNFCSLICKDVDVSVIWKKLETMYDLATLDESESITTKGEKFALPLSTFGELMKKAKLGPTETELSTSHTEKPEVQRNESNSEGVIAKVDETGNKKEEGEMKSTVTSLKDLQKSDSSVKPEIVIKPAKRESKDSKKVSTKEKDKKETSAKKELQDTIKTEPKESPSKKDDDKEVAKKNEKVKRDHKEYKKTKKKESLDKKTPEHQKKENESKKIDSSKKTDSKSESTKPTRVEMLKRESLFDKRKESPDKKTEVKTTDKKGENYKTPDRKNDLNKSTDKKIDGSKSSDKKGDQKSSEKKTDSSKSSSSDKKGDQKSSEKKTDSSKSSEKKSDTNKSAEKKSEKKVDKKLDKSLNSRTPEAGSNSGVKSPDGSGKLGGKTPDVSRKLKEKRDSESEKPDKESFSLKRLRDSWSSDDTPVKRPKGRPTRNSGEAVIKPTPSNTIVPGKRRRVL